MWMGVIYMLGITGVAVMVLYGNWIKKKGAPWTDEYLDQMRQYKPKQEFRVEPIKAPTPTLTPIRAPEPERYPYYAKSIMTPTEQLLYTKLTHALPECMVFSQVQLSQILGVKRGFNYMEWHNRINRMSVDYVVCHRDFRIIAIIELDDRTHLRDDRIKCDIKKDKALASAGLRIIRWNVGREPNGHGIREAIFNLGQQRH